MWGKKSRCLNLGGTWNCSYSWADSIKWEEMLIRKIKHKNQDKSITTCITNYTRTEKYFEAQTSKAECIYCTAIKKKTRGGHLTSRKRTVRHRYSCFPSLFACKFQKKHWEHLEITLPTSGDGELTILWESAMEIHYYIFIFKKWGTTIFFKKAIRISAQYKSLERTGNSENNTNI